MIIYANTIKSSLEVLSIFTQWPKDLCNQVLEIQVERLIRLSHQIKIEIHFILLSSSQRIHPNPVFPCFTAYCTHVAAQRLHVKMKTLSSS